MFIGNFHKIISKDNAKYNCFSIDTLYLQVLTTFPIKRKKEKTHLQENGFKGFKNTFINNGV
jgi:hypothetical protein